MMNITNTPGSNGLSRIAPTRSKQVTSKWLVFFKKTFTVQLISIFTLSAAIAYAYIKQMNGENSMGFAVLGVMLIALPPTVVMSTISVIAIPFYITKNTISRGELTFCITVFVLSLLISLYGIWWLSNLFLP